MTITATKPAGNAAAGPRWANVSPGTVRLEPSSGAKDTGWTDGERPEYNVMNWLQGVIYDWQQYLEDATDELEDTKYNRDGSLTITGDIIPETNEGFNFGSSTFRFNFGYFDRVQIDTALFARTDGVPNIGSTSSKFNEAHVDVLFSRNAPIAAGILVLADLSTWTGSYTRNVGMSATITRGLGGQLISVAFASALADALYIVTPCMISGFAGNHRIHADNFSASGFDMWVTDASAALPGGATDKVDLDSGPYTLGFVVYNLIPE